MLSSFSSPDNESGDVSDSNISVPDGSTPAIVQLRQLAMMYHSKGRLKEAQEIYRLVLELTAKENRAKSDQ